MIFLDSSYIKGLILNDDYNHLAKRIKPFLKNETKAINLTVLIEVLNAVKKRNFDKDIDELYSSLLEMDIFDLLIIEDYDKSMELFNHYDRSINFSDCTIIHSMFKYKIRRIVSFDSDFDKIKGFERIH